jgi:phosphate acetyltransferase
MSDIPGSHPRLLALINRARAHTQGNPLPLGVVYPGNAMALEVALQAHQLGLIAPVLIGPRALIQSTADTASLNIEALEIVEPADPAPAASAQLATELVRSGKVRALMKGSLHTDELMAAIVSRSSGMRTESRISHLFVFDLPRYPKLLGLADCVVNISPNLHAKEHILTNALRALNALGISRPKVAIVAAVESVNPHIQATLDAQMLVAAHQQGRWPEAMIEGPFGFDNAVSSEAARIKGMHSEVAGDADLMLMPDLNAGNMLYKSFNYIGGGDCAGLVLGASVPIVLTSRSDSALARLASIALATLTTTSATQVQS